MWRAVYCLTAVLAVGVEYVQKVIDSPLEDIQWVTDNVILVLSEGGQLYRSEDGGRSWKTQNPRFGADTKITGIDISPIDKNFIFFRGTGGTSITTRDMGKSYSVSTLDIHDCRLHPTQAEWILASAMSKGCTASAPRKTAGACFKQLFYSKDFGKTWTHAVDYVVQFDWSPTWGLVNAAGERESDHLTFATVQSLKDGDQKFGAWDKNIHFVQSSNFFNSVEVVVQHGNRFLFGEHNYLFVAAVNPANEEEVTLEVSRDNTTLRFFTASLPVDLTEHSYTILDTSEGSVFLHVNHRPFGESAKMGHVYISDWSGLRYSLSLPYNRRSAEGKCDFDKVEGMEGVYIANFVDVEDKFGDDEEKDEVVDKKLRGTGRLHTSVTKTKTVITYDKGAEWSYLKAPKVGADGKPIVCSGECHLHLHGLTDAYGPFYSTKKAVGLLMGTGTVGRYLRQNNALNTYISRDAGVSWREVAKGSHIYEFGDHGGLVVMAKDNVQTKTILYSWDEGATWTELQISEEPFQVENVIIEPTSIAQQFVVYGWRDDVGVLVYLDFAELHERTCKGHDAPDTTASDYETWTPSDNKDNKCVMGHTVTYIRRKASSQCFNPEEFERPTFMEHCVCTRSDFECDYGFESKSIEGGPCVPAVMKHPDPTQGGPCHEFSRITKGYRRVPGDTCLGGAEWDAELVPCPSVWISSSHSGSLVMFILFVIAATLLLVALASKYNFAGKWGSVVRDKFSEARYRIVGGNVPVSVQDDENFYLNEDEFGQSAQPIKEEEGQRKYSALPQSRSTGGSVPVIPGPADTLDEL